MTEYKKKLQQMEYKDLSPEKQAEIDKIHAEHKKRMQEINRNALKDYAKITAGGLLQGASMLPVFNIPYLGTGLGGAMFDAGAGIVEGNNAKDIAKRASRGFVIGETVGAVPYVGKAASKTKVGQAVGKQFGKVIQAGAANPAVQKAYDVLMTDIKAFNPNKQTVYHGSPYDFEKFSNEAIGTGEGAQAHGMGHYAALGKDTAEAYAKNLSEGNKVIEYNGNIYKSNAEFKPNEYNYKMLSDIKTDGLEAAKNFYKDQEQWAREKLAKSNDKKWWEDTVKAAEGTNKLLDMVNPNLISDIRPDTGQLYKLSVPKDDVMLREDASLIEQPEQIQRAIEKMYADAAKKGNMKLAGIFGSNGKETYRDLSKYFNSQEKANQYLNKYGIKGISYNGGIDGEARVIFNPDDIDIVRKFYNQPEAIDYLNKMKPNSGAVANAFNDYITKEEKKQWKRYAKDNLIGNSVDIPNYTTVNFTNKNLGEDYPYNMPEYVNLLDNLKNSQYQFSTNYKNETDRLYDHLTKEDKNRLFDYLIEVIKDPEGNIHHNYKMMKNITRGDLP